MVDLDEEFERMIDLAGRQKVFAIVRKAGWTVADSIPLYVWMEACAIASRSKEPTNAR